MNTDALSTVRPLFRDRTAAVANSLVIAWTVGGWLLSFALMGAAAPLLNLAGVLLCTHTMVLAAYLIHEAAHQTLFAMHGANTLVGEAMNCIASSGCGSFERIRHMHIRHHVDRADVTCFDFKGLMRRHPAVRRMLQALEWAYVPATEILMHLQVVARPFIIPSQRAHRSRAALVLGVRFGLLALLGWWSVKALLLYGLATLMLLHVLNFFDAFHHTYDQYFVAPDEPVALNGRDRRFEQDNTYSNLVSQRYPWLNLLTLNFGYHNAHHHRASVPWYRLPTLHRELYGDGNPQVLPLRELVRSWHRHRVRRVFADEYGAPAPSGAGRADAFVGAHGVSFLSVI